MWYTINLFSFLTFVGLLEKDVEGEGGEMGRKTWSSLRAIDFQFWRLQRITRDET